MKSNNSYNWSAEDGSPYRKPNVSYEFEPMTIQILNEEFENHALRKINHSEGFSVIIPNVIRFWQLNEISKPSQSLLISGFYEKKPGCYHPLSSDYWEIPEKLYFDISRPLEIYISYPFSCLVEVKINPLKEIWRYDTRTLEESDYPLGYIVWQIGVAYENLYSKRWKELGNWGHEYSDLSIGSIVIYPNNVIKANADS